MVGLTLNERVADWITGRTSLPRARDLRNEGFRIDSTPEFRGQIRRNFIEQYGFSIPCLDVVTVLEELQPLVEVGAGSGYWTALLQNRGLDIIGTEPFENTFAFKRAHHVELEQLTAAEAVLKYPERNVFASWPGAWAFDAVQVMQKGRKFAIIGGEFGEQIEPAGGTTGHPLMAQFLHLDECFSIPQFTGIDDDLSIYTKMS